MALRTISLLLLCAVAYAAVDEAWTEQTADATAHNNVCQHLVDGSPKCCQATADCGSNNACWACGADGTAWVDGKQYVCNEIDDESDDSSDDSSADEPMCKDWDATKKGLKKLNPPISGYAECQGSAGTKECWNTWCEANCEECNGAAECGGKKLHEACALSSDSVNTKTRCKCDDDDMMLASDDDSWDFGGLKAQAAQAVAKARAAAEDAAARVKEAAAKASAAQASSEGSSEVQAKAQEAAAAGASEGSSEVQAKAAQAKVLEAAKAAQAKVLEAAKAAQEKTQKAAANIHKTAGSWFA